MTKQEYDRKKVELDAKHRLEKNVLMKEFAFSNNLGVITEGHMKINRKDIEK